MESRGASGERGVILNPKNEPELGADSIEQMHARGIPHLHSALLISRQVRDKVELLVQQRASKLNYGDHWDFSSAGHCTERDFGIASKLHSRTNIADFVALQREAREEICVGLEGLCMNIPYLVLDSHNAWHHVVNADIRRARNSLHIPKDGDNLAESPIITVVHFEIQGGKSFHLTRVNPDVADVQWAPVRDVQKENLTPWFNHYLGVLFSHDTHRQIRR